MQLIFANLAGIWGLASIAAILAIHLLQQRSARVEISTLFLVPESVLESQSGQTIERLENSLPLWLQLIAALLLCWVLLEPRWLRSDTLQRVVLVLDDSLSMEVSKNSFKDTVFPSLEKLAAAAPRTEWILITTNLSRPTLYTGLELEELKKALLSFEPKSLTHDFSPALQMAQRLSNRQGLIALISDRLSPTVPGVQQLLVGTKIENVGFSGAHVAIEDGDLYWKAFVHNYGQSEASRNWSVSVGGAKTAEQSISIAPRKSILLKGLFPKKADKIEVVLSSDLFELDNRLPLVRPQQKPLRVRVAVDVPGRLGFVKLLSLLPEIELVEALHISQLVVRGILGTENRLPQENAIYIALDLEAKDLKQAKQVAAEEHPLLEDLVWGNLLVRTTFPVKPQADDEILLWADRQPLVFLRTQGSFQQLILNFNPELSNTGNTATSLSLLVKRFVELNRSKHIALTKQNVEGNQSIYLAFDSTGTKLTEKISSSNSTEDQITELTHLQAAVYRAPTRAGFFSIVQGQTKLEDSATFFSDSREADFNDAIQKNSLHDQALSLARNNSVADFLRPVWIILFAMLVLLNWHFLGSSKEVSVAELDL